MSVHLCTFLSVLPVYLHFMYISLLSLLWMVYCLYWVFVCVCCAAPDKLMSPPPFTRLGALHRPSREVGGCCRSTKGEDDVRRRSWGSRGLSVDVDCGD